MIRSAKIMLLGEIAVGKTSIAKRLVFDRFDSDYKTTIGVNVLSHEVTVYAGGANKMRLVIWDTDGDFTHGGPGLGEGPDIFTPQPSQRTRHHGRATRQPKEDVERT